ncbi:zinc finger, CCHC-type containing protein [Tanacetum coccineum]
MFKLNIVNKNIASAFMSTSKLNNSILWHARLGHVYIKRMQDMSKDGLIPAFDMDTEKCKTCMLNKITKKPFQNVKCKTDVLELIHSDLCGLHATPSLGNKKYFMTFIDDASRTESGVLGAVVRLPDPKLKTLGKIGIECIFVGYVEHSKAFRLYVIKPNDSILINSIIKSRDSIFNKNRLSSIPRPSLRIHNGTEDIGGSVVPEEVTEEDDPKTFDESMKSQDVALWKEAINDEIDSIMGNNTWVLADLPPGCKPLSFKWIFKRKLMVDGTIEKFKAKLVIQDFKQKSGIDYFDTYAPVARISTIRLLIAMTSIHNLIIHQMDVKTTFLNGDLEEEFYMNQPQGFIMPGNGNKVCKLIKSLYGLKHEPKQWHQKFDEVVLCNGYLLNQADKCVYSKFDESGKGVIICLYVDDMLIFGTDQVQSHYIEKVLKKFNYFDCTPVSTPMDTSKKLMPNNGQAVSQLEYSRVIGCLMYVMTCTRTDIAFGCWKVTLMQAGSATLETIHLQVFNYFDCKAVSQLEYIRVIGCLMYAMTCTRPDIAFVMGKLSRYTSNPGTQHWQAIQRVLKYLKKTMNYILTYTGYPSVLEGYTNASWISNTEDNSSTNTAWWWSISWDSKKQTCITGSTIESEFVALAATGKEAEWLKNLLLEILLWSKPIAPISIRCDSAATLAKAYSQMYNRMSKHLGVRHSMIRKLITNGVISIEFVRSQQNLANHLTKRLARDLVIKFAEGM